MIFTMFSAIHNQFWRWFVGVADKNSSFWSTQFVKGTFPYTSSLRTNISYFIHYGCVTKATRHRISYCSHNKSLLSLLKDKVNSFKIYLLTKGRACEYTQISYNLYHIYIKKSRNWERCFYENQYDFL